MEGSGMNFNAISISELAIQGNIALKHITDLSYHCSINEHGILYIAGIMENETNSNITGERIKLMRYSNAGDIVLFCGYITKLEQDFQAGLWHVRVTALTGSWLLDQEKKSRAFQRTEQTYKDLIKQAAGAGVVVSNQIKDYVAEQMYIQYEETDWQFIKRLASRINTYVTPSICEHRYLAHIGNINSKVVEFDNEMHQKRINLEVFRKRKALTPCSITDFYQYMINSYNSELSLGDNVSFLGNGWIVAGKSMQLNKGLIEFTYKISRVNAIAEPVYNNLLIQGISLPGTVLSIDGEQLEVCLDISGDENKSSPFPITYTPITGNIMYSMPEIQSKVMVYCPAADEASAIVINTVMEDYQYPHADKKSLVTAHKKAVSLTAQEITVSGVEQNNILELLDVKGVLCLSDKRVKITAEKGIVFTSEAGIYANTNGQYHLENIPSRDKVIISGNELIFETKHAELSGYLNPYENDSARTLDIKGMNQSAQYAGNLLGAIPSGAGLNGAAVLGAIPACMDISANGQIGNMIFLGRGE